jgi:protein involved in polysaccharide export with SLBB domain
VELVDKGGHTMRVAMFVMGVSCLLAGCNSPATTGSIDLRQAPIATSGGALKLQGGDKIKVIVFGEEHLTGEYEIDPAGDVSLPLAGTVHAAGLTKPELEKALAKKFSGEYLRNPKVTVDIASFRPFYVLGEVAKPGEQPYKSGLNVMSALAVAGGPTYRASGSKVMIQRAGESAMREYPLDTSVPIYPGDLIRVPERYF